MELTEIHQINKNHKYFNECDRICFLSKNLYNSALYLINNQYKENKSYLNYFDVNKQFSSTNQIDYRCLPSKVSQQILMVLDRNFKSFFKLLEKNKDLNLNPKICYYKHKTNGRNLCVYTNQSIYKNTLQLSQTNIFLPTKINHKDIKQVRVIPVDNFNYKIEIIYTKNELPLKDDNSSYAGIDIGLNNLFTVAFNDKLNRNLIINGRPLKSINQYYNKKKAIIQSQLEKCQRKKKSNKLNRLTRKRNNKIKDYVHKSTKELVEKLKQSQISKVVIGKNDNLKTEINLGKKSNQNFVSIPHANAINILKYKLELNGIQVIIREESYTSKCSILDNEPIKFHKIYKGQRVKRGLFKSFKGLTINADINGAANILKKEFPMAYTDGIEGLLVNPVKLKVKL